MPKFLFVYHGGGQPETPEEGEKVMAAWGAWMGSHADAWADGGAPVGDSKTVHADKAVTNSGGANPATGYSVFEAADEAAALEAAKGCPILDSGGTVEVAAVVDI